jgi:hypothetical protein
MTMAEEQKRVQKSYRLEPETLERIKIIRAYYHYRSDAEAIDMAIEALHWNMESEISKDLYPEQWQKKKKDPE